VKEHALVRVGEAYEFGDIARRQAFDIA